MNYGDTNQYRGATESSRFLEWNSGFAYRPICFDKLNLLARYTFLRDFGVDQQRELTGGFGADTEAHIFAIDAVYDISRYFGLAQKFAFKRSTLYAAYDDTVAVNSFLSASRINFHVTRKWDFAVEYRILSQSYAMETLRQGVVVELDRAIYEYVRLGVGYNFTNFTDDLRYLNGNYSTTDNLRAQGFFVRMTGKF